MFKKHAVALGVVSLLSGCMTTPVCEPDTVVNIPQSEVPSQSSADMKVIVLPVDLDFDDPAKKKLQSVVRNELESQIVSSGADLVDRKLANKLKKEIKLAEQSGRYNTKGVPIADLAVITEITSSDLSYKHTEAHKAKNLFTGKEEWVAASCDFKVDFTAVAKVVRLPDMTLVKRIELEGDEYMSTETTNSRCPISEATYQGLASKAAAESVDYSSDIKKLLAASAPVIELRQCEAAGAMVRVEMGSDKNVTPNAKIAFSKIIKNAQGEEETFSVGEGEVINNPEHGIKANYSWVTIDDDTAKKIQIGDSARLVAGLDCPIYDLECIERMLTE